MRALLVTYNFPPVSSAGVWRTLKLAKYLPAHGVTPSVLTVSNPSVPTIDEELERELDPAMEVVRARTFEPGYGMKKAVWQSSANGGPPSLARRLRGAAMSTAKSALFPDPQILWLPHASWRLGQRLARRGAEDVVFITAPPFSQFFMGPLARLRPGTAVVLDYRDEWITYRTTYEMMGGLGRVIGGPLERALVHSAHAITTATEAFRENLLATFPALSPDKVVAIPNGYDPDDFPADLPAPPSDRFVLTYAGTVFKLTSPRGLVGALRRLREREPELHRLLRVRFIGRVVDTEEHLFEGAEELGIERLGYVEKEAVLRAQAASHLVLCLLSAEAGNERIYPGKIFELMYLGRPVLTLAPPGALASLVERHELGAVLRPLDEAGIAAYLEARLREFSRGEYVASAQPSGIERFHRRAQAGQFAEVFSRARERARA